MHVAVPGSASNMGAGEPLEGNFFMATMIGPTLRIVL